MIPFGASMPCGAGSSSQYFIDTMVTELIILYIYIQHKVISMMEMLQPDILKRFVAANTPIKISRPKQATFLDVLHWARLEDPKEARCGGPLIES